jgi:hypothetical protein
VSKKTELKKTSPKGSVKQYLESVQDTLDITASFTPNMQQTMAKHRFWGHLKSNPILTTNIKDMGLEHIASLAGVPNQFFKWADKEAGFLIWFCDEGYADRKMQAYADVAFDVLVDIATSPIEFKMLTAKDKVAAANLLLQLADRFPNKRREFVYIDKELAKMTEADVIREDKKLDRLLSEANGVLSGANGVLSGKVDNDVDTEE